MDVFSFRDRVVGEYARFTRSFATIAAADLRNFVDQAYEGDLFWPSPTVQLNPSFEPGGTIDELVAEGVLHAECGRIFRLSKPDRRSGRRPLRLHRHQEEAIRVARGGGHYVLTTGTGSGKSLAYIVPIVDHVLRRGASGAGGHQAIVVYPMNALANSQHGELEKFLCARLPATAEAGQLRPLHRPGEATSSGSAILANPPDILLTNYVMLELILTRPEERQPLVRAAAGPAVPGARRAAHLPRPAGRRRRPAGPPGPRAPRRRRPPVRRHVGHPGRRGRPRRAAAQVAEVASQLFGVPGPARARHRRDAARGSRRRDAPTTPASGA